MPRGAPFAPNMYRCRRFPTIRLKYVRLWLAFLIRLQIVPLQLAFPVRLKYVPSQLAFSRSAYFCTDLDIRLKYVSGILSNSLTRSKYAPPYWYKSGSSGISRLNHVCMNIGSVRTDDGRIPQSHRVLRHGIERSAQLLGYGGECTPPQAWIVVSAGLTVRS